MAKGIQGMENFDTTDESELDRTWMVDGQNDKVKITTEIVQELDPETFMQSFKQKCADYRQIQRTIRDTENHIEDILEERDTAMKVLHSISQDEKQRGDPEANSVTTEDIEQYSQIKNAEKQLEQKREEKKDLEEDFEDLKTVARQVVSLYDDVEMPDLWTEFVQEEVECEDS